jgi:hypothetical protein
MIPGRLNLIILLHGLVLVPVIAFSVDSGAQIQSIRSFASGRSTAQLLFGRSGSSLSRLPSIGASHPDPRYPTMKSRTSLRMYNLPPSGGGGGNGGIRQILTSVVSLLAIVAFFVSPLGALFFTVLNSFFLASLILPAFLWIGFQTWLFFNTVEGPCPQCGAPVRVAKEQESPSICLNCGTFVQVSPDKSSVDFYREDDQVIIDEGYTASIWDSLLGGPTGTRSAPSSGTSPTERQARFNREQTVIDVEVEEQD